MFAALSYTDQTGGQQLAEGGAGRKRVAPRLVFLAGQHAAVPLERGAVVLINGNLHAAHSVTAVRVIEGASKGGGQGIHDGAIDWRSTGRLSRSGIGFVVDYDIGIG